MVNVEIPGGGYSNGGNNPWGRSDYDFTSKGMAQRYTHKGVGPLRVHAAKGNPPQTHEPAPIKLLVQPIQARQAVRSNLAAFVHAERRQIMSKDPVRVPAVLWRPMVDTFI